MRTVGLPYVVAESAWLWPPRPRNTVRRFLRDRWLARLVAMVRPQVTVETGVFLGRSTTVLLAASEPWNGIVYSIDISATTPDGHPTGRLVPRALRSRWRLVIGDSRVELPKLLAGIGDVDLFIHDSDHSREMMAWEYGQAWPHIRNGGALASDDVRLNDAFDAFSAGIGKRTGVVRSPYGEQAAIFA